MTYLKRFFGILAFAWLLAAVAFAQYNTVTSTTLSSAVAATDSIINVASATGITADPQTTLYIDREVMPVVSVSGTAITVRRTARATAHISGAVVWVGRPNWFRSTDPSGACTVTTEHVHPWVNTATGSVWYCSGGRWNPVGDNYVFISPGNCWMTAATTTISTGPALVRAAANNLVLSGTTNTTAGTLTVTCSIDPPMRTTTGKGPVLTDVYLLYGIQTTAMASIAPADIKSVTYPAAGAAAAGTVSSALGGTLTVTPTTLALTTTTAGQCHAEKISFGTPIAASTDLRRLTLEQVFTTAGSTATTLQICGVLVHYSNNPL